MLWAPYSTEPKEFLVASSYLGQTARQRELQRYETCWLGIQYDDRPFLWDGRSSSNPDAPPGTFSGGAGSTVPERWQRVPCVQSKLGGLIVRRFSDMLFGEGRRPSQSTGDADSDDWLTAAWQQADGWLEVLEARDYGGAMGTQGMSARAGMDVPHGIRPGISAGLRDGP